MILPGRAARSDANRPRAKRRWPPPRPTERCPAHRGAADGAAEAEEDGSAGPAVVAVRQFLWLWQQRPRQPAQPAAAARARACRARRPTSDARRRCRDSSRANPQSGRCESNRTRRSLLTLRANRCPRRRMTLLAVIAPARRRTARRARHQQRQRKADAAGDQQRAERIVLHFPARPLPSRRASVSPLLA